MKVVMISWSNVSFREPARRSAPFRTPFFQERKFTRHFSKFFFEKFLLKMSFFFAWIIRMEAIIKNVAAKNDTSRALFWIDKRALYLF